ncbi:MAG: PTS sugar transporter subunit IIA [Fibrobacter sp.]|jgi:PTS system fructose-specific IIC component/PTS system nitrogen regulatory IIA component|nr:PTS sugar transporter subunit IIA [Fibrobacter sp.]
MRLSERFVDNSIIIDCQSTDKKSVLNELVDTLCRAYQLEHRDEIFEMVWNREKSRSTGIGCGLAVPHAKMDYVDRMCMAAATLEKGIDFDALDGEPVYLLILIVSPGNTVGPHLKALSSVSRLLADGVVRKELIKAKTPAEFLTILRNAEDKYL